jgi:hypothetical protein
MVDNFCTQIFETLNLKETDELVEIWKKNDRVEWSEQAFDVIQEILQFRLGETPKQNKPIFEYAEEDMKNDEEARWKKEMIMGVWKRFLYTLPIILGFMAFAISLSLGCFIAGFSGVIVAVKKEAPSGRGTVRGTWAVVSGILTTLLFWAGAAYFFWIELSIKWWGF